MRKYLFPLSLVFSLLVLFVVAGCSDVLMAPSGEGPRSLGKQAAAEVYFEPQMGVNYNGQFDRINYRDLQRTETTWVRGFVDFFQFYENPKKLKDDRRLQKYLELKDNGYKTILNIKWNFRRRGGFPEPKSREMKDYKQFLHKLLMEVWSETDILIVGNEPFIESKKGERGEELVTFYKEIAREVHNFKKGRGRGGGKGLGIRDVPIYVGAFNNLYLKGWQTEAVEELFAFARSEPWIAGVDLHIHHGGTRQMLEFLNYADARLRSDQRFLVTEFSLVKHFRRNMEETIPAAFASEYGWDPGTKNYQYIDHALKNPVPRAEWGDFLSKSYWYENRTRYLRNAYRRFKRYDKFYIATYAMRQSFPFNRDFGRNTPPWILNGIYANRTVRPDSETGQNQFNYAWIEDFVAIQNGIFDD